MSVAVSVVVPAYNAALYLKQTLESIFAQTYRNYEIVLVDDGSTDETAQIAQQFGDSIRYIYQSNRGLSAARNTAIKNARAGIIALLDADDLWEPDYLEKMVPYLDLYPEAAGVYCGFQYINSTGHIVGKPSLTIVPPGLFHSMMVDRGNWLVPSGVIFRRYLAEEVGLFDESLHGVQDWDLWISLSRNRPFIGVPEALVKYRRHENNMSSDPERMINDIHQLTIKLYGSTEGDVSKWSPAKQRAFISHYCGGAQSFFAVGRIQKSIDYLKKLVEISPEYACSLSVWRGFARSHIPDEYQFESSSYHDWGLIRDALDELFRELNREENLSGKMRGVRNRLKGFAFLAVADEAGRSNQPVQASKWLVMTVRAYSLMLFERPFWGTIYRSVLARIKSLSKTQGMKAAV